MRLNTIKPGPGSKRKRLRVGRGASAGQGKTCGKGGKGQKARKGGYHKVGFEGGQVPLQRRLPKVGFRSAMKKTRAEVTLTDLEKVKAELIDLASLLAASIVPARDRAREGDPVRRDQAQGDAAGPVRGRDQGRARGDRKGRRQDRRGQGGLRAGNRAWQLRLAMRRSQSVKSRASPRCAIACCSCWARSSCTASAPSCRCPASIRSRSRACSRARKARSSACSTCSRAARCSASRSSRWASCPTSRRPSSCR